VNNKGVNFQRGLILACALLTTAGSIGARAFAEEASSPGSALQRPTAAVFRFSVQPASATDTTSPSLQACAEDNTRSSVEDPAAQNRVAVDPMILDDISNQLQQKLSKKMSVMVDPDLNAVPVGGLMVSGCVFQAEKGNKAERMIGLGLGASRLGAHIVVLAKTETGFIPMDSFDVQVKGRTFLPPAGPVGIGVNAAKEFRETLSADAKKLADHIVKRMNKDIKQQGS